MKGTLFMILNQLMNPGLLLFGLIKLCGYTVLLKMMLKSSIYFSFLVSFIRMVLGLTLGLILLKFMGPYSHHLFVFYFMITFLRLIEWYLVLSLFYPQEFKHKMKSTGISVLASMILDPLAVFGIISLDGLIC